METTSIRMQLFLLTVGRFLLTVELLYLQLCLGAVLTCSWSFLPYNWSFSTYNQSFFAYSGKVPLRSTFSMDCKQRSSTVSKKAPAVSKKLPRTQFYYNFNYVHVQKRGFGEFCPKLYASVLVRFPKERKGQGEG